MISLYCASKFALEGFTEAPAYELASQNIGVKLFIPHGGVTGANCSEKSAAEGGKGPLSATMTISSMAPIRLTPSWSRRDR